MHNSGYITYSTSSTQTALANIKTVSLNLQPILLTFYIVVLTQQFSSASQEISIDITIAIFKKCPVYLTFFGCFFANQFFFHSFFFNISSAYNQKCVSPKLTILTFSNFLKMIQKCLCTGSEESKIRICHLRRVIIAYVHLYV